MANPAPKFKSYIKANKINKKRIKLPKNVSNKLTNNPGTANITSHKTISNVINPTTRLRFFLENMLPKDNAII